MAHISVALALVVTAVFSYLNHLTMTQLFAAQNPPTLELRSSNHYAQPHTSRLAVVFANVGGSTAHNVCASVTDVEGSSFDTCGPERDTTQIVSIAAPTNVQPDSTARFLFNLIERDEGIDWGNYRHVRPEEHAPLGHPSISIALRYADTLGNTYESDPFVFVAW
jgi:hypothetical protein